MKSFRTSCLSVSHPAQVTFSTTPCVKLIENQHGRAWPQIEGRPIMCAPQPTPGSPIGPTLPT